jgi:hypothetical protein
MRKVKAMRKERAERRERVLRVRVKRLMFVGEDLEDWSKVVSDDVGEGCGWVCFARICGWR